MNEETAFRMVEVIDYDIAKELRMDDPDELISMAEQMIAIAHGDA